jgi:hypothetical protein
MARSGMRRPRSGVRTPSPADSHTTTIHDPPCIDILRAVAPGDLLTAWHSLVAISIGANSDHVADGRGLCLDLAALGCQGGAFSLQACLVSLTGEARAGFALAFDSCERSRQLPEAPRRHVLSSWPDRRHSRNAEKAMNLALRTLFRSANGLVSDRPKTRRCSVTNDR